MNSINAVEKLRNLTLTITVAVASFVVQDINMSSIILNIFPYIVLCPLLMISENHLNDVYFLSAYLIQYLEKDKDMPKWETRLQRYRQEPYKIGKNPSLKKKYSTINQMPYYAMAVLCFALGIVKDKFNLFSIILGLLSWILFSKVYLSIIKDHHRSFATYLREWKKVKAKASNCSKNVKM